MLYFYYLCSGSESAQCQYTDGADKTPQYPSVSRSLVVTVRGLCRQIHYGLALLSAMVLVCSGAEAADKLEPFSAEFTVLESSAGIWSDIDVVLDFRIHNDTAGSLIGSKFICRNEIEGLSVSDGSGKRLPLTLKKYPRRRVIWEYGPARNGTRRARISFTMKNAVKRERESYVVDIDWVGGWTRPVYDVSYTIRLPQSIRKKDVLSAVPAQYSMRSTENGSVIAYRFPKLAAKSLKLVIAAPAKRVPKKNEAKAAPRDQKQDARYRLRDIRYGKRGKNRERLVFDFNRRPPFRIEVLPEKKLVTVTWDTALTIDEKAAAKKKIETGFIESVSWSSKNAQKLSCTLSLKESGLRVKYGGLRNPPRLYVDFIREKKAEPEKAQKPVAQAVAVQDDDASEGNGTSVPEDQEEKKNAREDASQTDDTPAEHEPRLQKKEAPIKQKLAYLKAKKFDTKKHYRKSLDLYESFIDQYPDSVLKEDVLYDIGEAYFNLAEESEEQPYDAAVDALKKAMIHFPHSDRAPQASFLIAESFRKRTFYIEAKGQYDLIIKRYPDAQIAVDARFWKAECLYNMQRFKQALKEYEQFVDAFPSSRFVKKASFRIADCYVKMKDYERAEYYYEKALKRWPDLVAIPVDTLNNIGMTYYYKGQFSKSREVFFVSFNLYPDQTDRAQLLLYIGDSYQWEEDLQRALNLYGYIMDMFPDTEENVIAAMRASDIGVNVAGLDAPLMNFHGFNPYQEPEKVYRWVIESGKTGDMRTEALYKLAYTHAKKGDYPQAVALFKEAMHSKEQGIYHKRSFENIQRILVKMINSAADNGDSLAVVEMYKQNEEPFLDGIEDCEFFYNVGTGFLTLGLYDFARDAYERFAYAQSQDEQCRQKTISRLAEIDIVKKDFEKARERLSILLYGDSKPSGTTRLQAEHLLADVNFFEHNYAKAVDLYTSAVRDPRSDVRHALSLFRLGEAFAKNGFVYNGLTTMKKFLVLAETLGQERSDMNMYAEQARMLIGDYLYETENYRAAVRHYQEIIESSAEEHKSGWAYIRMGDALLALGEHEDAVDVYGKAVAAWPYTYFGKYAQSKIDEISWNIAMQQDINQFL